MLSQSIGNVHLIAYTARLMYDSYSGILKVTRDTELWWSITFRRGLTIYLLNISTTLQGTILAGF